MANKLGTLIKTAIDAYVATLTPTQKAEWDSTTRLGLQNSMFNQVEKWNDELIEITGNYTVTENAGNQIIVLKSSGVSADVTVTLPAVSTNAGRKLVFRNLNTAYNMTIQRAGSDTIESVTEFEIWKGYNYSLEFFCCSDEWKRTSRQWVLLNESDRDSDWTLNAGAATSFTDINFSSFRPKGSIYVQLNTLLYLSGNGARDFVRAYFRPKGSTETDPERLHYTMSRYDNLATGLLSNNSRTVLCKISNDGYVQYSLDNAYGTVYVTNEGFQI